MVNKIPNAGMYAVALAIATVGALWLGVPLATLALLAVVLVCPLMMMFMMRGMHGRESGGGDQGRGHTHEQHDQQHRHPSVQE